MTDAPSFAALGVSAPVVRALSRRGITSPFPIQAMVVPDALAGMDVLAKSPTGSGKTLAFALPILERLRPEDGIPGAVILAPTRELTSQILEEMTPLAQAAGLNMAAVYGGIRIDKQAAAAARAHVLVATPGRLIDLLDRRAVRLGRVRVLVLDEADRMLDMGFRPQTDRIVAAAPEDRQTMLFSATLDGDIPDLARAYTRGAARYQHDAVEGEQGEMTHRFTPVAPGAKLDTLVDLLTTEPERGLTLVFSRTKRGAERLRERLDGRGVAATALHGDMAQSARTRSLARFARGEVDVLVATDVAARGIDLDGVTHVVHFDAPETREDFVHRSGRTARAGREGTCITLVTPDQEADLSRLASACGLEDEFRAAGMQVAQAKVLYASPTKPAAAPAAAAPAGDAAVPERKANRVPRGSRRVSETPAP
ncbi:MAG: DEAD/DEAH box helicase [Thermoleophilia bacterium]|nr:DEAD/DEAH box helicase [Thermoleophilia bacterium]